MLVENSPLRATSCAVSCAVCGCDHVASDEVAHRGRLLLRECTRCRHRWTETPGGPGDREPAPARRVRPARPRGEVVRAA